MADPIAGLRQFMESALAGRTDLRVLEAGCGSASWLDLRDRGHVLGIDISEKQLARNELIHEGIQGDLMIHRFPPGSFDVIVCIDVLEHLDRPAAALANLAEALGPGGLLVLKLPNLMSLKGLTTKLTPHRFHVWVYRHLFGRPDAGTHDVAPFPTFLRWNIRPAGLRRWGESELILHYQDYYESGFQRRLRDRLGPADVLVRLVDLLVTALSLGRLSLAKTEYVAVFGRPAAGR